MSDRESVYKPSKGKRRFLLHATIGGLLIGLTSLWALTVTYDISREELISFLLGTLLMFAIVLIAAALLVLLVKLPQLIFSKLRGSDKNTDNNDHSGR